MCVFLFEIQLTLYQRIERKLFWFLLLLTIMLRNGKTYGFNKVLSYQLV